MYIYIYIYSFEIFNFHWISIADHEHDIKCNLALRTLTAVIQCLTDTSATTDAHVASIELPLNYTYYVHIYQTKHD